MPCTAEKMVIYSILDAVRERKASYRRYVASER
jgi:hypothetical protein